MKDSLFENWRERSSSLGHILTNLPKSYTKQEIQATEKRLADLKYEKDTGKSHKTDRAVKWTESKADEYAKLNAIKLANYKPKDELPDGAITHLNHIFNTVYHGRGKVVFRRAMRKGHLQEQDSLELMSFIDGVFLVKNDERLFNDYIEGEPDNRQNMIRDAKSNEHLDSFDSATLTSLYKWQVKGYCWLDGKTEGKVCYCLVNTPIDDLLGALSWARKEMRLSWIPEEDLMEGFLEDDPDEYKEKAQQIERNMIFDKPKFAKDHPNYVFFNEDDFSMHPAHRYKEFPVTFTEEDKEHIIRRVIMCREYLMKKEAEENQKIIDFNNSRK